MKQILRILFVCCWAVLVIPHGVAQNCGDVRYVEPLFEVSTTFNVQYQQARPYGSLISLPYTMDIYEPVGDTLSCRPLMVFQYGGAFLIGDKLLPPAPDFCSYWAQRGYVAVSVDYRLGFSAASEESAERAVYRAVQDLQAALRFLSEFREQYRIDTGNIIVSGNSAGAFTTLHNTFMDESQAPASYAGVGIGLDSYSLGGIYESGNSYWGNQEVITHGIIVNWGAILDTNFIGDGADDIVPTILFHGTNDNLVPYASGQPFDSPFFPLVYGSELINDRLDNTSIPHKFVPLIGAGHEPELVNSAYLDTILWESQPFMYHHVLKPWIQTVAGNQSPNVNDTELYSVVANEPIIQVCVSVNNGTVVSNQQNEFEILWNVAGHDTIQVIAGNKILAYDTTYVPVFVSPSTDVLERDDDFVARIYPNPFSSYTTIHLTSDSEPGDMLLVSDVMGRVVYRQPFWSNSLTLSADKIGEGIYSVNIKSATGRLKQLGRIVVQ